MPYLTDHDKNHWTIALETIKNVFKTLFYHVNGNKLVAGTLNYLFTKIAHIYIEVKGEKYQNYNDIIGALEGAKLELYRRRVSKYEDKKIKKNGDV